MATHDIEPRLETTKHRVDNGEGWRLELTCYRHPERFDPARRPAVMVPGYCMNTHVLSYHPGGPSTVERLCQEGIEVWTAHLRGQGDSHHISGSPHFGFEDHALVDFPTVRRFVLDETRTGADMLDAVGCSVGGDRPVRLPRPPPRGPRHR